MFLVRKRVKNKQATNNFEKSSKKQMITTKQCLKKKSTQKSCLSKSKNCLLKYDLCIYYEMQLSIRIQMESVTDTPLNSTVGKTTVLQYRRSEDLGA